jgi:eukaryotic-like serine/threonine-protein kinase
VKWTVSIVSAERHERLESIYHAARTRPPADRPSFVARACEGDLDLQHEVESLLAQPVSEDGVLETPLEVLAAGVLGRAGGALTPGTRLGTYEVLGPLGAGGMGEVYRARDVRLGRPVALKIVVASKIDDPQSLKRLEEEARSASILNHPNIVTIYGVGEEGSVTFIAMELVQGRTLRAILAAGTMTVPRALALAAQLAEALAVAHAAGIVHRDLKPENIMITEDGTLKVLDFGLARRQDRSEPVLPVDNEVTRVALTMHGTILGTVGYMSPEQAAGRVAGPAADQFSFGLIVYEMLAGRRAFQRDTAAETLSAIINEHPVPIQSLNAEVAGGLQQIVERCLAKDPGARFADTGQLAGEVRAVRDAWSAPPLGLLTRRRAIGLGGAAAVAVAIAAGWRLRPSPSGPRSLAVLPFVNDASDADVDYLCDGLTENLIRRISHLPALRVMASSTVLNFKGKAIDPRDVGRQLDVSAILTGTVTRKAGRVIISAELVDVASGAQLWSNRYDRQASDVLQVQDDIATAIVDEGIRLRPTVDERRQLARRPTDNAEAYELYLRGRYAIQVDDEDGYLKGRELFRQAVAMDPSFALAFVSLSSTYTVMAVDGFERPTDAWPNANLYLRKALELDPTSTDASAKAADSAFFFDWDWTEAERKWEAIVQSNHNLVAPELLRPYALECWALGRPADALRVARRIRDYDPVSVTFRVNEADYLIKAGKLDEAVSAYEKVIHDEPGDPRAYFGLSEARRAQRRFDDAIDARRRGQRAAADDSLDEVIANARGEGGLADIEQQAARLELAAGASRAKTGAYVSPLDVARSHALLGDGEKAFSLFDAAFADRAVGLVFLNVDRAWDSVRGDPRFRDAARRVGLPVIPSSS